MKIPEWNMHGRTILAALLACACMLAGCADPPPSEDGLVFDAPAPTPAATKRATGLSVVRLTRGEPARFDWDGDGYLDEIMVVGQSGGGPAITITSFNGESADLQADMAEIYDIYLYTNAAGIPCLILTGDMLADDYVTYLYSYDSEQQIKPAGSMRGLITALTPPAVTMQTVCEALGSWIATRTFTLDDAFQLNDEDGVWELQGQGDRYLSALCELEVEVWKDGGYQKRTLLPGVELLPTATDQNGLIYFDLRDGGEGRLMVTLSPEGETLVNGQAEEACFGNLQYAG